MVNKMTDKTFYQIKMLARAEKGREVMYPGLRKKCPWLHYPESGCKGAPGIDMAIKKPKCDGSGFIPNPDLGALIEAAQVRCFSMRIIREYGGQRRVQLCPVDGIGSGNLSALIDAMFQATEADNWGECVPCGGSGMDLIGSPPQPQGGEHGICHGTGKVEVPHEAQ